MLFKISPFLAGLTAGDCHLVSKPERLINTFPDSHVANHFYLRLVSFVLSSQEASLHFTVKKHLNKSVIRHYGIKRTIQVLISLKKFSL